MSTGRMSEFAQICSGALVGDDCIFTGVSTDTRSLKANDLFIALQGPSFDGHEFLQQAQQLGASGFVISKDGCERVPHVRVDNTRRALGTFAAAWRKRFTIPVAAITGSNGKTSTKEMLASIVRVKNETLATTGNMNNDIGAPLTLLKLKRSHQAAVIEIGTNAPGEIEYLTSLVAPTVGVITNASSAHLEKLGSVEGVAEEKGALLRGLDSSATAVVNADDRFSDYWKEQLTTDNVLTFGEARDADFRFSNLEQSVDGGSAKLRFNMHTPNGTRRIVVPMAGRHHALNAVAAAATAQAMGVSLDDIEAGLSTSNGIAGRMQIHLANCGARIIDDSYNSNPASARAAIHFLSEQKEAGWLVLGDMGELGSNAPDMHASIGKLARELGVERLFAVGTHSRAAVAAFGNDAQWFETLDELKDALGAALTQDKNVLIKASRSMRLERLVESLCLPVTEKASNEKNGVSTC
ncbi:MAG: UDP-N-acetylmuramoyl-tripeptide--D-alanyl-D-alanine ligase [Gammaproteobacteria bacterium]